VTDGLIDQFLSECEDLGLRDADPQLDAIRMAILVEDVFGLVLSDEQISPTVIGDRAALRDLLAHSMNAR
jgi:hypothetical protein